MIPRILHYCWFGGGTLPSDHQRYITNWKKHMPNWTLRKWDESNAPANDYLSNALQQGNWANASNWMRLRALADEGGIYLDTDIEILRSLEPLRTETAFVGFEVKHADWEGCVNNAVFGAEPRHKFTQTLLERIEQEFDGTEEAHRSSPHLTTRVLEEWGLKKYGRQTVQSVEVFPVEYFYPFGWHEDFSPDCLRKETYSIHWYGRSWTNVKLPLRRRLRACWHLARWRLFRSRYLVRIGAQ